ncbi:hypothetical protein chiPu_0027211, partial [Chiloscyllium punctatum]|nr:hypothetical protein [Chiloscyllium punctatum]
ATRRALFRGDVLRALTERLDAILDLAKRGEATLDMPVRYVAQYVACDRVAQTVEIVDQAAPGPGQEQAIGAAIPGVGAAFEQAVLDQAVKQPHQRDRLQFEDVGEIDLGKPLLLAQPEQNDPLGTRGPSRLGAMIDIVAQQPRALDELRDELAFEIERHRGPRCVSQTEYFCSFLT